MWAARGRGRAGARAPLAQLLLWAVLASLCKAQLVSDAYHATQLDSGFALQLLGNAWAGTRRPVSFAARQGFTVQLYYRPLSLSDTHDMHIVQFVNNPVELERHTISSNASAFGTFLPATRENVVLDLYTAAGRLFLDVGNVTVPLPATAGALFSKLKWQLITVSLDLLNRKASIFADSLRLSEGTIGGGAALLLRSIVGQGVTGHAFVGRPRWGTRLIGEVDDFRLLARPLEAASVASIFQHRNLPTGVAEFAMLEWRFDELRLRDIVDSSAGGLNDGTVYIERGTTNPDGSTFSSISPAPAVRFDGFTAAKVPSSAGLDAVTSGSVRGATSPAIARRSADVDGRLVSVNTSTAVRVIDGRMGRRETFTLMLVPRSHNVTVAALARHGTVFLPGVSGTGSDTPLALGQQLTSSSNGVIQLAYIPTSGLRSSAARADVISFAGFSLSGSAASTAGDVGLHVKWVARLDLVMLVNEVPIAPSFRATLAEDAVQHVYLGAFGDVSVAGKHFQADTEGQRLSANITLVPTRGKLYQADNTTGASSAAARGRQILQSDVPVTLTGSGNQLVYVPPADVSGRAVDVLSYTLADDVGSRSRSANITFDVTPVHDPPTPGVCSLSGGNRSAAGSVQLSRLTASQQSAELAWVTRSCAGLCEPEVVRVAEDGTIDFKLIINSKEDSLVMVDMVSAPCHGSLHQLMTSSRNQNPATAPKRLVNLAASRSASLTVWAHSVVGVSSQRSSGSLAWSAARVVGAPDVYPLAGDSELAWSPSGKLPQEWIELEFGERLYVTSIQIYETWFPGHITRISFRHPDGTWIPAWRGSVSHSDGTSGKTSRAFSPPMCAIPFPTSQVRLDLNISTFGALSGGVFPQIDAVLMTGTWTPPPRRLLFTPGPTSAVAQVGHAGDASSDWGAIGGAGSGGTGSRRGSGTVGRYASSGGSGGALSGLQTTPKPVYWLRYTPSKDFSGVDRLVFATNDCDWDREFKGIVLPCQEVALRVIPSNDPPELLNPWGLDATSAAGGLLGVSDAINATIVALSSNSETASAASATRWKLSVKLEAPECIIGSHRTQAIQELRRNVTAAFSVARQDALASVLGECGVSFLLRSRDPDIEDRSTTFVALSSPKKGTQVVSRPLAGSTKLNLRVDAASYKSALSDVNDFVAACSILDTSSQASSNAAASGTWTNDLFTESGATSSELGRRRMQTSAAPSLTSITNGISTGIGAQGQQATSAGTTLEQQKMTAAVASFFPNTGVCGSAAETLLFWASDTGVADLYGDGGTNGAADSLASAVLRAVIDVRCAPGTRRVTDLAALVIMIGAAVAGAIVLLGMVSFSVCWARRVSLIRRAQPIVNLLSGAGSLVLVGAVLMELLPPSAGLCDAKRAVQSLGFILAFGAPASKVFRVFRLLIKIHLNTSLSRVAFPESALLMVLAALVVVEALFVGAWSALSPTSLVPLVDPVEPMITHLRCSGPSHSVFFGGWVLLHMALVAFTIYLAAITRNVHYQRGESRWIGYTVYLQSILTVGGVVLYTALEGTPQTQTFAVCVVVLLGSTVAPVFMLMRRTALAMGVCEFSRTYDLAAKGGRSRTKSSSIGSSNATSQAGRGRFASTRPSRASDPGAPQGTLTRASEASQGPVSMQPGRSRMVSPGSFSSTGALSTSRDRKLTPGSAVGGRGPSNLLNFGSARDFMSSYNSEAPAGGAARSAASEAGGSRFMPGGSASGIGDTASPRAVQGKGSWTAGAQVASAGGASKRVAPARTSLSQPGEAIISGGGAPQ